MKLRPAVLAVLVLVLPFCGLTQLRMSFMGGPHSASVIEKNNIPGWDTATSPNYSARSGFHAGFMVQIPLGHSSRWFLQPSIQYQGKGRKYFQRNDSTVAAISDTISSNNSFFTNYIEIPFLLTYKLPIGKKSFFILSAGPYASFFYNGKSTAETRLFASNDYRKEERDLEVGKAPGKVQTLDVGVHGRAGFEFSKVLLTGFYSRGLSSFYQAGYDATFNHRVIGASLGFWLNPAPAIAPRDRDNDGIEDKLDECPTLPGSALTNGCPDRDGDGIADIRDKCPDVPGSSKYEGCPIPDRDNDGVNDEEDKCPDVFGYARYGGCPIPDRDGDGIDDEKDACPDVAGVAQFKGCPVPDRDNDGVNDLDDKCPDQPGPKENGGCPVVEKKVVEQVQMAARQIYFKLNSDELSPESFQALDDIAKVLSEFPQTTMRISGHTDNTGTVQANQELSQKRAQAVKDYLVRKAVSADRLEALGFGSAKPVASNASAEGRSKNRRVEIELIK